MERIKKSDLLYIYLDMDALEPVWQEFNLEKIEGVSARDVHAHFINTMYPKIKERFFWVPAVVTTTKKTIWNIFSKKTLPAKIEEPMTFQENVDKNLLFWAEVAKWIFEFIIWDHVNNIQRINLFLGVMYLEMMATAYVNAWLDFDRCAKMFESEWRKDKSRIIEESLKLCDVKFRKWVTTIEFGKDHLIFRNWYWTTLQSKKDFFEDLKK